MSEKEKNGGDELVLDMVHEAAVSRPRRVGYIVSEADARRLMAYDREAAIARKREEAMPWLKKTMRVLGGVSRGCVGMIFLAGAMEGLMDPVFAGVVAACCAAWGGIWYQWGYRHG